MSERKAVIKNADMSEVRLGRVASWRATPDRFRGSAGHARPRQSSPRSPRSSARPSLASSGETRRLGHDPRLTSLFRALPPSSRFAGTPAGCHRLRHAGTTSSGGATARWTFGLSTFRLTAARGARRARCEGDRGARGSPRSTPDSPRASHPGRGRRARPRVARRDAGSAPLGGFLGPPARSRAPPSFDPGRRSRGSSRALIPSRMSLLSLRRLPPLAREVQHREGHRRVHQEGVRQEVQPHLALHRRPQLRLLRHARDEARSTSLSGSRGAPLQVRLNPARSGSAGLNRA